MSKELEPLVYEYFECDCGANEHLLKFILDPDEKEIHAYFYLNSYGNFFKRIYYAIKYIFGYKSKYGDWQGWSLGRQDLKRLRNYCDKLLKVTVDKQI